MAGLVESTVIAGGAVYGVRQVQYTVEGVSGQDFATALTAASFKQAAAIEESAGSFAAVIRQRQKKVDNLGEVLAVLARAIASMSTKNTQSGDKSAEIGDLSDAKSKAAAYGITISLTDSDKKITRGTALKVQNEVRYQLDVEDNSLQQDIVSLQSLFTKRDNSFSNAAKIVKKALNASASAIRNIG